MRPDPTTVDEAKHRAKVEQRQGADAQRCSDGAQVRAREALDWISERNALADRKTNERATSPTASN
jgi:hypothetical protein